jgi:hypothetical protein
VRRGCSLDCARDEAESSDKAQPRNKSGKDHPSSNAIRLFVIRFPLVPHITTFRHCFPVASEKKRVTGLSSASNFVGLGGIAESYFETLKKIELLF